MNLEKMKMAAAEKTKLINTLCADLKIPVQQTTTLITSLLPYVTASQHGSGAAIGPGASQDKIAHEVTDYLQNNLSAISTVIDHTLFLMRVREGRYVFTCEDDILLAELLSRTLKDLLTCYSLTKHIMDDEVDRNYTNKAMNSNSNLVLDSLYVSESLLY
jgi:hypothetical protein